MTEEKTLSEAEAALEEAQAQIQESRDRVNNSRLDHRNAIADAADEALAEEFDVELQEEVAALEEAEGLEQDEPVEEKSRPTIKVNGKEVELTDELIRKAQLISATEAARMLQQAKNPAKPSSDVSRNPAIHSDAGSKVEDIDFAEVAAALQSGTTEEIAAQLKKLANRGVSQRDVYAQAQDAVKLEDATNWYREEYDDLVSDPFLQALTIQEDKRLMAEGFDGSYKERFKVVGDTVRAWKESIAGTPVVQKEESTLSKKEKLPSRTPAAAKKQAPREVDEGEEDPRDVIAEMARKRRGY